MLSLHVRPLERSDAPGCDAIMEGLPEWFGLEAGLDDCRKAVRGPDGLVADLDGEIVGFVTWRQATPVAMEITWLAVRRDLHRQGVGRSLVDALVARAPAHGARVLTAWTVSDDDPDPGYARTRQAYAAFGFMPVAKAEIWGPENPAVLLLRPLG